MDRLQKVTFGLNQTSDGVLDMNALEGNCEVFQWFNCNLHLQPEMPIEVILLRVAVSISPNQV